MSKCGLATLTFNNILRWVQCLIYLCFHLCFRFLEDHIDILFPRDRENKDETPVLCTMKPDTRPVPDPKNKIPATLAQMISSGDMSPCEAIMKMREYEDETSTVMSSAYDSNDDEDDDDSSYCSESDFDSDEEEELYEIVGQIGNLTLQSIEEH